MGKDQILANTMYLRALARADKEGVEVLGKVYSKGSDHAFLGWAIQGAHNVYYVRQEGRQLVCNCKAAENSNYCKHRAVVTRQMLEENSKLEDVSTTEQAAWTAAVVDPAYEAWTENEAARANSLPSRNGSGPRIFR